MNTWNASLYKQKHAFVFNYGESLIELLNPKKDERILDLGCGSGELTAEIGKQCKEIVGIDASKEMIEEAKSRFSKIEFLQENATKFRSEKLFDAIFSNAALHWVKDYNNAIETMFCNLKPGGRIVLEFGGKGNVGQIVNALKTVLTLNHFNEESKTDLWFFPSIAEYTSLLEKAGFKVTFAKLYDRPTELIDNENGIKDWLNMFGQSFFKGIENSKKDELLSEIQDQLKPILFSNDKWIADYVRLRIIAFK